MFGYVNVFKDELKIKDYNTYRAYYCGLCKLLGKRFGSFYRLGLSYDFTFLALVLDGASDVKTHFSLEGCARHLGKKRLVVQKNFALEYAADMSVALNFYKLADDIADNTFSKSALIYPPYKKALKKVSKKDFETYEFIKLQLDKLSKLEKESCNQPDIVSDTFAQIMKKVFSKQKNLEEFGYNLGKYIYLIDALDDLENDIKKKSYNPFFEKYGDDYEKIIPSAEFVITFTLARLAEEFEKIEFFKNREIIKNIVYLGLRARLDSVLKKYSDKKENKNEKSI